MQAPFSCTPSTFAGIEKSLSAARLRRYLPAAQSDRDAAFRLYLWNAELCAAFYLPIQMTEVALRNAIQAMLSPKFGANWHLQTSFMATLPRRLRDRLSDAIRLEQQKSGNTPNADQIVSALNYGFWLHFLTKRYETHLSSRDRSIGFPNARNLSREELHRKFDRVRITRNRIAHHEPIFDRQPSADFANILECVGFICSDTQWLVMQLSRVQQTINERPRC